MTHSAKILADSISKNNNRLTTLEITYPRIVHGEMLRHRMHSRCVASSRAIPVNTFIEQVSNNPYMPIHWGKNQKGMQADVELSQDEQSQSKKIWIDASHSVIDFAQKLSNIGVHKQITNRLLETFQWTTEIISGTDWENFFNLRIHTAAHPEINKIAQLIKDAMDHSIPVALSDGQWHLPLVSNEDWNIINQYENPVEIAKQISAGRCARTSYLTHDGKRDIKADIELAERLVKSFHFSPTEHLARPMTTPEFHSYWRWEALFDDGEVACFPYDSAYTVTGDIAPPFRVNDIVDNKKVLHVHGSAYCGNFNGWVQYRKTIPFEWNALLK